VQWSQRTTQPQYTVHSCKLFFLLYTQVNPTPEEQTRKKKNVDDGKSVYVVDTSPELRATHPDSVWLYLVKNVFEQSPCM